MARLFGRNARRRREAWHVFSEDIGGEFVPGRGMKRPDTIYAGYKNWEIVFDSFARSTGKTVILYTRVRAFYLNSDSFQFRITKAHLLSGLGKKLGMQDVVVGYPEFDKDYIIQGNDETKLKMFFRGDRIRQLIFSLPSSILEIKPDKNWAIDAFREGKSELYFEVVGIHYKDDILFRLFDLFAETLDQLFEIGSAHKDGPPLQR